MDTNDRLKLYEKIYFFELDRKEKLLSRLSLPLAISVALSSLLSAMLEKAPPHTDGILGILFWIFYLCGMITAGLGVCYFWRTWQLRDFDKLLPDLSTLDSYHTELEQHFAQYGENDNDTEVHFREVMIHLYIVCTTTNTENNDRRTGYFSSMATNVALTFILAMFSFAMLHLYQREVKNNEPTEAAATAATIPALCQRQRSA